MEANNRMLELADKLAEVRDSLDELESRQKELNKEKEQIERELFEMMLAEDVEKFTRNGRTFSPQVKTYASINAEYREAAFQWLKDNGFGDLVKEQVNTNSLTSWYKEQIEEGELPEEFLAYLNVYDKQGIAVRKAR